MELRVLGPVELWARGERVRLGGPRATKLLAALGLNAGRTMSVARLVEVLWDDDPPATATRQVRNTAAALRRLLDTVTPGGGEVLVTDGPGYRLAPGRLRIDADLFADRLAMARDLLAAGETAKAVNEMRDALSLCRGDALTGVDSRVLAFAAVELDQRRLATLEECLGLELDLGRHRELAGELAAVVAEHPLRERFTALLMLALYRSGRPGEALAAYRRLRARLAAELGLDPGPDLHRLESAILRADPALELPAEPATEAPITPRQLPADSPVFAGRGAQLAELDSLGARENVRTVIIDGPPGVGKTTLAVRFAHRVADRFPDGQLYLDLAGFDAGGAPLPAGAVLRRLLRALDADPRRIPTDLDEQAALYRTLLAGRRVLILLDNAAGTEQVRPLLPGGPAGLVLITSRNRLSGLVARHGAHRLTLDPLAATEAGLLLRRLVGAGRVDREPEAAAALADLAAGLPLALCVIGERANRLPSTPLADLAGELRAERRRLDALQTGDDDATSVRTVFSYSYRALDSAAARVFRLLSLAPGRDIGPAAAAALTGWSTSDTRRRLDALAGASLLTEHRAGRYSLHDLLRAYARESSGAEPERRAAIGRVLDFYLHTAHAAHLRLARLAWPVPLEPPRAGVSPLVFADHRQALAWCETERENLVAATECAAAHGFDGHAWRLPCVLWEFYYLRKHWADWVATHEIGLAAARRCGDRTAQARVLNGLGAAHGDQGRLDAARDHYARSLDLACAIGDRYTEAVARHNLGVVHRAEGRQHEALRHFRRALRIDRGVGEPAGEGIVLAAIADCYRHLGRYDDALAHYRKAIAIHQAGCGGRAEASARHGMGECHRQLGRYDDALEHYRQAAALYRAAGDEAATAATRTGMGTAHRDAGHPDLARRCWREALDVFARLGDARADRVRHLLATGQPPYLSSP